MITLDYRGEGGVPKGPKMDYVILECSLIGLCFGEQTIHGLDRVKMLLINVFLQANRSCLFSVLDI